MFHTLKDRLPLVAILRGLEPERAVAVAETLIDAGFDILELPLNSPSPFESIAAIVEACGDRALIGAGTVMTVDDVKHLAQTGAQLVVSPNCNRAVIEHSVAAGMVCLPGVLTPTEMFSALDAGATGLKIFPAELMPPSGIKAVRAVLPKDCPVYVVGGIDAGNMRQFLAAGATGFGMGSAIFRPGKAIEAIAADARALIEAFEAARAA